MYGKIFHFPKSNGIFFRLNIIKMDIGLRIKQLRTENNYTQKAFSDMFKIDNSQMSKIEKGKLMPTISFLMEISSKLNTSVDWILTGHGKVLMNNEYKTEQPENNLNEELNKYNKKEISALKRMESKIDMLTNLIIDIKNDLK